jgi:hypothetical protein
VKITTPTIDDNNVTLQQSGDLLLEKTISSSFSSLVALVWLGHMVAVSVAMPKTRIGGRFSVLFLMRACFCEERFSDSCFFGKSRKTTVCRTNNHDTATIMLFFSMTLHGEE